MVRVNSNSENSNNNWGGVKPTMPKSKSSKSIFSENADYSMSKTKNGYVVEFYGKNSDGSSLAHVACEFDEKGNKKKYMIDYKGGGSDGKSPDGVAERVETYKYDEQGNMIEKEVTFYTTVDDKIEEISTSKYKNNFLIEKTIDTVGAGTYGLEPDGIPDDITEYKRDEEGNLIQIENDSHGSSYGADGITDSRIHYIRDEVGKLKSIAYDNNADGIIDDELKKK